MDNTELRQRPRKRERRKRKEDGDITGKRERLDLGGVRNCIGLV